MQFSVTAVKVAYGAAPPLNPFTFCVRRALSRGGDVWLSVWRVCFWGGGREGEACTEQEPGTRAGGNGG